MYKKLSINESKAKLFEMMQKVNPDYVNEEVGKGVDFKQIIPEDQQLFNQVFGNPELRGASGPNYEGNYIKTRKFRFWDDAEGIVFRREVQNKIDAFNKQSIGFYMELKGLQDWDTDDDRTWDASYSFTFFPK